MTTVFRISLRQIEAFHGSWVATQLIAEDAHIVGDVLLVVAETMLSADGLQRLCALLHHRHSSPALGFGEADKRLDTIWVDAFCHPVVHQRRETLWRSRARRPDEEALRLFGASDLHEAHALTNGHGVGGPGSGKLLPWPDLHDALVSTSRFQEGLATDVVRLESLAEKVLQLLVFLRGQSVAHLNVEAELARKDLDVQRSRCLLQGEVVVQAGDAVYMHQRRHRLIKQL
mmetsp:Transcript_60640/g.169448  ORF Transcript_60640/g.169448 Transcript_60640/m.169448 type:complete len:230 (-) Transcript_60640:63-752(-)